MGDLILSFPLILSLQERFPGTPVWVVAEPQFFSPLLSLAPQVTFFEPASLHVLSRTPYLLAINLSSRPEAARCMGEIRADEKLGPTLEHGALHIHGFWHLYRHSLTQNNRHNTFHWADLFRMDLYPGCTGFRPLYMHRRAIQGRRIAIVVGASTPDKHPGATFWTQLTLHLLQNGAYPLLFGGPDEAPLGERIAGRVGLPGIDLCGKLPLHDVAMLLRTVDICITPDTGPMHLANWMGIPTINLSMGPVRADDTGPYGPDQYVLVPKTSCAGCWSCSHRNHRCKRCFTPKETAQLALGLLDGVPAPSDMRHTAILRSGFDSRGYYCLSGRKETCQTLLDTFWRTVFLELFRDSPEADTSEEIRTQYQKILGAWPLIARKIQAGLQSIISVALRGMRRQNMDLTHDLFLGQPPLIRILTGYYEMYLQNSNATQKEWRTICTWTAHILELCTDV